MSSWVHNTSKDVNVGFGGSGIVLEDDGRKPRKWQQHVLKEYDIRKHRRMSWINISQKLVPSGLISSWQLEVLQEVNFKSLAILLRHVYDYLI